MQHKNRPFSTRLEQSNIVNLDGLYPDGLLRDRQAKVNGLREPQSSSGEELRLSPLGVDVKETP